MNSELRTKLRNLAEQSIPGPWEVVEKQDPKMISSWSIDIDGMELSFFPYKYHYADETKTSGGYVTDRQKMATGKLIAQMNPSVVLQLLDYIEQLEQVEENLCKLHNVALEQCDDFVNIAAELLSELMDVAISNGADSRSMPDRYVEIALLISKMGETVEVH